MKKHTNHSTIDLLPLDISGAWNLPLLENAASISDAGLRYARSGLLLSADAVEIDGIQPIEDLLPKYEHVLACETGKRSVSLFEYQAPRGKTVLIVGNEEQGIPKDVLKKVDDVVSIPMYGPGMSSVNVAVAAAIALYLLERDLGRKGVQRPGLRQEEVELLIRAPEDPSELGSLLRTVWAFGWRKVFVDDPHGTWFTQDAETVLAGRAAARRSKNPVVVIPASEIRLEHYEHLIHFDPDGSGAPASRLVLPTGGRTLVVIGWEDFEGEDFETSEDVFLDRANNKVIPCFRHSGSIFLALLSKMLRGVWRG